MANELDDRAHKHTHTLAARGLKKNYGSRQVVKGVDLSVKSGEVVGLLGPNGAGKTTTFYMVVGLVVADGGDIELDGRSIARLPIYKRARLGVSYLPQEASVFRKLSVEDNIRAILEMQVDETAGHSIQAKLNIALRCFLTNCKLSIYAPTQHFHSRAANAAAQKSPVPLRLTLGSFSWMNPSLVLIRLP